MTTSYTVQSVYEGLRANRYNYYSVIGALVIITNTYCGCLILYVQVKISANYSRPVEGTSHEPSGIVPAAAPSSTHVQKGKQVERPLVPPPCCDGYY